MRGREEELAEIKLHEKIMWKLTSLKVNLKCLSSKNSFERRYHACLSSATSEKLGY